MVFILDEIDYKILACLRANAKIQLREMAEKVGIHTNTLMQRIEKLKRNKIITNYSIQVDYSRIGLDLQVIIMMRVKKGRAGDSEQFKDITNMKEIESIYAVTGLWDVIAVARVKSRDHLLEIIQKIGKIPIVMKTTSQLVLYTYKSPAAYNPFVKEWKERINK